MLSGMVSLGVQVKKLIEKKNNPCFQGQQSGLRVFYVQNTGVSQTKQFKKTKKAVLWG
jgi:hypothetical protein